MVTGPPGVNGPLAQRAVEVGPSLGDEHVPIHPLGMVAVPAQGPLPSTSIATGRLVKVRKLYIFLNCLIIALLQKVSINAKPRLLEVLFGN